MVLARHRRSPFLLGRYAHVKRQKMVHGTRVQAQTPLLAELSKQGHHSQAPLPACSSDHITSPADGFENPVLRPVIIVSSALRPLQTGPTRGDCLRYL